MSFIHRVKSLFYASGVPYDRRGLTDVFLGIGLLVGVTFVWHDYLFVGSSLLLILVCAHFVVLRINAHRREKNLVWYGAVLDSSTYSIIGTTSDGVIKLFNSGAEQMLGYERAEMIGLRTPECIHLEEEIIERAKELSLELGREIKPGFDVFTVIAQEKGHEEHDWTYVCKDGKRISVRLVVSGVFDKEGKTLGFMGVAQDITHLKSALSALRQSEERFRGAFEHSGIGMALVSLEGKWLRVNEALCRIVGYSKEELLQITFQDITHVEDLHTDLEYLKETVSGKRQTYNMEKRYIRGDGTIVWAHLTVSLVRDSEKKPLYFISQIADISALKSSQAALRSSAEIKRMFVEHAPAAVAMLDRNMRYIEVSRNWYKDYGLVEENIIGRSHYDVFPNIPDEWKVIHQECLAGATRSSDSDSFIRPDGSQQWLCWKVCPWLDSDGGIGGIIMFTQDITHQHHLEAELKAARDRALEASHMKSDFLASMSHEIRTPMNGIIGMNALLAQTLETDDQKEMSLIIQNSAENLMTIINDILDFSKIEAGKMRIEETEIDLKFIIEETLALLAPRAHHMNIELINEYPSDMDTHYWGDGSRIQQILINLVGNAIKFTEEGGEVSVSVSSTPESAGYQLVKIEVTDDGIGIAKEHQKMLFNPFVQAESGTKRSHGGTGLGLSICNQLVELMGGEIGLQSELGSGSTFWFKLPMKQRGTRRGGSTGLSDNLRILYVDDNAHNRKILGAQLRGMDIESKGVSSADETMKVLDQAFKAKQPYDAVLLDWYMPEVDGIELAQIIRSDRRFAHIVLVLLSSAVVVEGNQSIQMAAFDAQLTKPIREQQLRDVLMKLLGRSPINRDQEKAQPKAQNVLQSHLLIAEDNRVNQLVAKRLLNYMGCCVDIAKNGKEALEMAARNPYDAILMDCQMPEMDGYEATHAIRRGIEGIDPQIKIIALTAYAMESDRLKCIQAGMNDYLSKPIREEDLRDVLLRNQIHLTMQDERE